MTYQGKAEQVFPTLMLVLQSLIHSIFISLLSVFALKPDFESEKGCPWSPLATIRFRSSVPCRTGLLMIQCAKVGFVI